MRCIMSTPLTTSQIHILAREKAHWRALELLKKHTIHHPEDTTHSTFYKKRKNGKMRRVFVYNVPDGYMYIKKLNGEFRGKYRVYRTN